MAWKVFDNNGALLVNLDDSLANGPIAFLSQSTITAFATGGQAGATQLTAIYNRVDTVVSNEDSVKLLPATKNTIMVVQNNGAADLNVFPYFGDTFLSQSVNTAWIYPIVNGQSISFLCYNTGTWTQIP